MSFASPLFLLAVLLVPLGIALQIAAKRRRRKYAVRFPAAATVALVAGSARPWRRHVPPVLLALSALALALAVARPQATVAVPIERASVVLVLDTSGSMMADDVAPTRLDAARQAAQRFIDRVPERLQVGVVAYATDAHTVVDPTTEHLRARAAIDTLIADGGTATGDALSAALDRLEARRKLDGGGAAPAAVVLLSDGKTTSGTDPLDAAERAKRLRIPVSTVALGTDSGTIETPQGPLVVPPDPETLREIAETSGGTAFTADDAEELDRVYESLGSKVGTRKEQRDVGYAFAAAGLLLLTGSTLSGVRWRGRIA